MAFDINERLFDELGGYRDETTTAYADELLHQFAESPEAQELTGTGATLQWARQLVDLGIDTQRVSPADMTAEQFRELLFRTFPQEVAAPATDAPQIVAELRAFWSFLQREFALPNAVDALAVLDEKSARRLEVAMSNPANYSPTKAMTMQGTARGYDLSTPESREQWEQIYNREQAQSAASRLPMGAPGLPMPGLGEDAGEDGAEEAPAPAHQPGKSASRGHDKSRRKMAKASQRKNRKK